MTQYTADTLDLSRLPVAPLVPADFDPLFEAALTGLVTEWNKARALDPSLPPFNTTRLATEPAVIQARAHTYVNALIRQAINDTAADLRLATAQGAALDHLTTTYHRTTRAELVAADLANAIPAVMEGDEELRERAQLAPEGLSEFGITPGGYIYKIRSNFAAKLKGVRGINRGGGHVEVRLLAREGDGSVEPALVAEIAAAFEGEDASQYTDVPTFLSAEIEPYDVSLTLIIPRGPDPEAVTAAAREGVLNLAAALHRLDAPVFMEAFSAAAHVGPVAKVRVNAPSADRPPRAHVAPRLRTLTIDTERL